MDVWKLDTGIVFYNPYNDINYTPLQIPCGQCIGCKLEKSRQWALRLMHEASLWDENSFITLTYDDEHLPKNKTLVKRDFQLFIKRLRKLNKQKIRYYHCGEYGDFTARPHYHAILFNKDFSDKKRFKKDLFISKELEASWPLGYSTIGSVDFDSAAYVARYCLKKITGPRAEAINQSNGLRHYERMKPSGEIIKILPEYATMSRRPGIANAWIKKYMNDVYPSDNIHVNGVCMKPAKYYDNVVKEIYPDEMAEIKQARLDNFNHEDNTPERLAAKKANTLARLSQLKNRGTFK